MIDLIARYLAAQPRRVLGLMSGTSADAVDAALVELSGAGRETRWRLVTHTQVPLPGTLRQAVLSVSAGGAARELGEGKGEVARLDSWIGEIFAVAALACIKESGLSPDAIHLIGSHGQTVCHLPEPFDCSGTPVRATLQLGNGALIAARTGLPVIADFRSADVALGGQGAPLAPFVDWILFASAGRPRAVQNLGGIGNVTYLPDVDLEGVLAYDTGPANMLTDAAVRHFSGGREAYDRDGQLARKGVVSSELLGWLLEHPFLGRRPPKSTCHEDFGESYFGGVLNEAGRRGLRPEDTVATLTALGPEAAVASYRAFLPAFPAEIILGGGGSLNPVAVQHFRRLCEGATVLTHEDFGIPAQAKEALAFAMLANETMSGNASNVPAATGARARAILGCLYPPPGR